MNWKPAQAPRVPARSRTPAAVTVAPARSQHRPDIGLSIPQCIGLQASWEGQSELRVRLCSKNSKCWGGASPSPCSLNVWAGPICMGRGLLRAWRVFEVGLGCGGGTWTSGRGPADTGMEGRGRGRGRAKCSVTLEVRRRWPTSVPGAVAR